MCTAFMAPGYVLYTMGASSSSSFHENARGLVCLPQYPDQKEAIHCSRRYWTTRLGQSIDQLASAKTPHRRSKHIGIGREILERPGRAGVEMREGAWEK